MADQAGIDPSSSAAEVAGMMRDRGFDEEAIRWCYAFWGKMLAPLPGLIYWNDSDGKMDAALRSVAPASSRSGAEAKNEAWASRHFADLRRALASTPSAALRSMDEPDRVPLAAMKAAAGVEVGNPVAEEAYYDHAIPSADKDSTIDDASRKLACGDSKCAVADGKARLAADDMPELGAPEGDSVVDPLNVKVAVGASGNVQMARAVSLLCDNVLCRVRHIQIPAGCHASCTCHIQIPAGCHASCTCHLVVCEHVRNGDIAADLTSRLEEEPPRPVAWAQHRWTGRVRYLIDCTLVRDRVDCDHNDSDPDSLDNVRVVLCKTGDCELAYGQGFHVHCERCFDHVLTAARNTATPC
jgi:hypothetical protein